MRIVVKSGRIFAALCLVFLGFGLPSISWAQGAPSGSYANSCNNIRMVDGILEASCQRADGSWVDAAMPNSGSCRYGVENDNGALACANPAPVQATTQSAAGLTNLTNTCGNQDAYFIVATNNKITNGIGIMLKPGQTIQLAVTQGSSYVWACGQTPTDMSHFQYFNINAGQ